MKRIITILCISCIFAFGCSDDAEESLLYPDNSEESVEGSIEEPGDEPEEEAEDEEDDYVPIDPDYSNLTPSNHPRVIYTDEDFAEIAALRSAGTNASFNVIHNAIISNADNTVNTTSDLERVLSGKRLLDVSRDAEKRILSCAYAYKTTGEKRYLEKAEHDINSVSAFSDWNAVTHFLDAGEMATAVGLAYDWLYNDLTEETKEAARKALNDFAFNPALYKVPESTFYSSTTNWNQVCNGGLVCAALAIYEDYTKDAQLIIDKALETNIVSMEAIYSPDGNYPEGYGYWNYGTLYEALMLTALEITTGSDSGISRVQGFPTTGKYMMFMEGPSDTCFNYSDCSKNSVPCIAQWYFAWKFNDYSVLFIEKDRTEKAYKEAEETRLLPLAAWYASKVNITDVSAPLEQIYYGEGTTPVVLVHDTWTMDTNDKFLGIKGGQAHTSHGHMDAGSFVFDAEGVRWASDLGNQSYTALEEVLDLWNMTDGSERWTVFRLNNFNHNTLTVNDAYHKASKPAIFTEIIDSNGKLGAVIDITPPLSDELSSAIRTLYLEGDDLVIQDEITALDTKDAAVQWKMVTLASPTIEYGEITLKQGNKTRYMTYSSSTGTKITWATWSAESENSWDASNSGYYECGYTVTVKAGDTVKIEIRLSSTDPLG